MEHVLIQSWLILYSQIIQLEISSLFKLNNEKSRLFNILGNMYWNKENSVLRNTRWCKRNNIKMYNIHSIAYADIMQIIRSWLYTCQLYLKRKRKKMLHSRSITLKYNNNNTILKKHINKCHFTFIWENLHYNIVCNFFFVIHILILLCSTIFCIL
jgi:hypothetical protein